MENNIRIALLKLYNGDMLIGKVPNDMLEGSDYVLSDPRAIVIAPSMSGGIRVMIASVCEPFKVKRLKERLVVKADQVMFALDESEVDSELINGYKSEVSGIQIASASDAAKLNANAPKAGDFIL